jgi:hypothetical protein
MSKKAVIFMDGGIWDRNFTKRRTVLSVGGPQATRMAWLVGTLKQAVLSFWAS